MGAQVSAEKIYRSLKAIDDFKALSFQLLGRQPGQTGILLLIRQLSDVEGRAPRPSQLSEIAGVMPATITSMLTKLELRGLICRESSKQDRREVMIRLTDEGDLLCKEVSDRIAERFRRLGEFVGEDAIDQFYHFTQKLAEFNRLETGNEPEGPFQRAGRRIPHPRF